MGNSAKFALLLTLALAVFTAALPAQDVAAITGSITDPSGAVVPGASVTLQNPQTGVVYKAVSNATGSYTINDVKAGPGYKLTATRDGFETTVLNGLYMNVGVTRTQNVKLVVGTVSQTVSVSATNQDVTLDTTDATIGNNFQVQYMQELPVMARDTPIEQGNRISK